MGDTGREKWDTEKMREHRNDWSLAADIHLFSYMQQFSQNLLGETHTTLKALDSLESEVATTCVEVSNIGNRFWALSDTQFVENRVYDDDDVTSPVAPTSFQDNQTEDSETVVIQRLKEAIQHGIHVLDSKFETVQVPASDSDEDDSSPNSGVILKPVNRYKERRLPHLIGSAEFRSDDTLGLRDAPSDEETDDFMSASDKANESESMGESEDSDIESEQTKTQHPVVQKQNSNPFIPQNLRLPGTIENVQANSNVSSLPSEDMFGEQGDDLFTQIAHKKPVFSSWQPSDLWGPEEDDEKRLVDDSSNNRPPSANSSISSAQSSNVSEPIKKTSEDFGKSGTGRQAVLVQEDQEDLFGSKTTSSTPPQAKEFVPAGGVKIFGGDFNPFSNRNLPKDNLSESSPPVVDQTRSEKNDVENDIFIKKQDVLSKVLPKVPPSNTFSKKKDVSLFDDEEEDDLFSKRLSDPQPKSQPSSMSSSHLSFRVDRSEAEEDDLFSNSSSISTTKTQLSHSIFKDSGFSDESEDLFSNFDNNKKQKMEKSAPVSQKLGDSIFSDEDPLDKDFQFRDDILSQKSKTQNARKDIFEDLFGNVPNLKGTNLSGGTPSLTKPRISSSVRKEQEEIQTSKPFKKDLFDESDDDNDNLFSTVSKGSKPNQKPIVHQDLLPGSKNSTPSQIGKQEVVEDDLFGPLRVSSDVKNHNKGKLSLLKPKKGLEKHSLFDSDSDDDLFSSPQGSLSSRKSVQSASALAEPSDREEKKKASKDSVNTRLPKTDFSSIFSNDEDEPTGLTLDKETDKSSNLFGEDQDLFSSLTVNVKTPDLFKNSSSKSVAETIEDSNQSSKIIENEIKIKTKFENKTIDVVETTNKYVKDRSEKPPVLPVPLMKDIFADSPPGIEEIAPIIKKPEPPKSLDIKPIVEILQNNQPESKEEYQEPTQKPPVLKKPSPKVLVEKSIPKDATDGEVISPPSPSKSLPGKLRASQLININTAALLPGAKPSKTEPQLESRVKTEPESPPLEPTPTPIPSSMPPKSSLLQSVNKERVKIQGKRRPSSRRARQEAIRASSLDTGIGADTEDSSVPPASSIPASTLISPSTDEEDLFGVPPLDVVYDVKTVSPSTDIFGTPTVLSPVTNKELPSSFVSTPFVHSQPPPLDEELEEGSNQEDDLFGSQSNLLGSLTKVKKPLEAEKEVQSNKGIATEDIFSDVEDDGLFQGIIEAPPPLLDDDDDDDDEEYDELFMPRKKKENIPNKISHNGSIIAAIESLPKENSLISRPPHSTVSSNCASSLPPKSTDLEDDLLFNPEGSIRQNPNSLFSTPEEPNEAINDDSLVNESVKHSKVVIEDSSFPFDSSGMKPSDSSLRVSNHAKDMKEDSLFSHPAGSDGENSSFFTKSAKVSSSDLFSSSDEITSNKPAAKFKEDESKASDGELFESLYKPSKVISDKSLAVSSSSVTAELEKSKPVRMIKDEKTAKKETLFGDDDEEEVGNLFSSVPEKKLKVKLSVKTSLFGDEDDDDDIFGALSSKKSDVKAVPLAIDSSKVSSLKSMKAVSSGSSKPVKLETKQTFSDPLFSNEDKA